MDVSAGGGGSITVNASNLNIKGGCQLNAGIAEGMGNVGATAGDITVNATGAVTIAGAGSRISNRVQPGALGRGGNIAITADSLLLADGAVIITQLQTNIRL